MVAKINGIRVNNPFAALVAGKGVVADVHLPVQAHGFNEGLEDLPFPAASSGQLDPKVLVNCAQIALLQFRQSGNKFPGQLFAGIHHGITAQSLQQPVHENQGHQFGKGALQPFQLIAVQHEIITFSVADFFGDRKHAGEAIQVPVHRAQADLNPQVVPQFPMQIFGCASAFPAVQGPQQVELALNRAYAQNRTPRSIRFPNISLPSRPFPASAPARKRNILRQRELYIDKEAQPLLPCSAAGWLIRGRA